ncbi:MAG: hypothetical protein JWN53_1958, partial [Gemmatimonadetes bacterium]|nr:hypothetical protein [Gemmatimonadota bacterium]
MDGCTAVHGYFSTRYQDWHTAPMNSGPRVDDRYARPA